jgi:hypothetical protein
MTWGGWNPESARSGTYKASIFGLTRSLPLFLSEYDRDDFPFDAVLLFGLHNDEIPLRHSGDADVMEIWNREYAYPKIVAMVGHIGRTRPEPMLELPRCSELLNRNWLLRKNSRA